MARLCLGKGARCSVLVKYLRPSKAVNEAIVNPMAGQCLDDLITVKHEITMCWGKNFSPLFIGAKLSPALTSILLGNGLLCLSKGPAICFGTRMGRRPKTEAPGHIVSAVIKQGEEIADFVSPTKHKNIKKVKDLAAAGVLITAVSALIVGLIIFIPKIT